MAHLDDLWSPPVNNHLTAICIIFSYTAPFMSLLDCWFLSLFFLEISFMAYFVPRAQPGSIFLVGTSLLKTILHSQPLLISHIKMNFSMVSPILFLIIRKVCGYVEHY